MDEGGVKLGAGGIILGVVVALVSRLRRPKSLALEDKRNEVETLGAAFRTLGDAMDLLQGRLDTCEQNHKDCEQGYEFLRKEINKMRPDDPIPAYTFTGGAREKQL